MMTYKAYAVYGDERATEEACKLMATITQELEQQGWIQRNLGDTDIDDECLNVIDDPDTVELIPNSTRYETPSYDLSQKLHSMEQAFMHHPTWKHCSSLERENYYRVTQLVVGYVVKANTKFIVCYLEDEPTNYALQLERLCQTKDIPIFNLAILGELDNLITFVEKYHVSNP